MPAKNILDLRRRLDAELTKGVLAVYNAQSLAEDCAHALSQIPSSDYYLKGGNALSLLQAQPVSGDWDFQFKPDKTAVYNQWATAYPAIDTRILGILQTLARNFVSSVAIENVFKNLADPEIQQLTGNVSQQNQTHCFTIGKAGYMLKSYNELINDLNYTKNTVTGDGRLVLNTDEIVVLPSAPSQQTNVVLPCVYVNYAIPGFILYRLAIRYQYSLTRPSNYYADPSKTTVTLKSELIDISVPRIGSSEVYMAQEGVVTNFFNVNTILGRYMKIPGWGYHLYENINLLQEIKLGISGSAHKKQKRIVRGIEAFQKLKGLNSGVQLIKNSGPIKDSATGNSIAFIGIYIRMLQCNIIASTVTNPSDRAALTSDLSNLLAGRAETSKLTDFLGLVDVDSAWLGRPLVSEMIDFIKAPLEVSYTPAKSGLGVTGVNIIEKKSRELDMLRTSTNFKIVSPLIELSLSTVFPLPFVLIQVSNPNLFNSLIPSPLFKDLTQALKLSAAVKVWRPIANTPTQSKANTPFYPRLIFVNTSQLSTNYSITEYLENSLLISQRQALANSYQGT